MSLNGIGSLPGIRLPQDARPRVEDRAGSPAAPAPAAPLQAPSQVRPGSRPGAATPGLPAEAPAGTDPELWAVLTTEERAFFSKVGAMGPLTYGHVLRTGSLASETPVNRGGRLDVRA